MDTGLDFSIYDHEGRLAAVAEAKKRPGITPAWAANWARNVLTHGDQPTPAYLLLFTPERVYLWKRPVASGETNPTYILDASVLFRTYYSRPEVDPERISPEGFDLLVRSWLHDALRQPWPGTGHDTQSLEQSGFLEAVRNGHVENVLSA
jgi:hypothetical protein